MLRSPTAPSRLSVRVCSPPSRRCAALRPRFAGLKAWTAAPRTLVQTTSCTTAPQSRPLHIVVDELSRLTQFLAPVDTDRNGHDHLRGQAHSATRPTAGTTDAEGTHRARTARQGRHRSRRRSRPRVGRPARHRKHASEGGDGAGYGRGGRRNRRGSAADGNGTGASRIVGGGTEEGVADSTNRSGAKPPPAARAETEGQRWTLVQDALANRRWEYRSIDGIAAETRLSHQQIERTLESHRGETRSILARSRHYDGARQVYTLRSRPRRLRDVAIDILGFASRDA